MWVLLLALALIAGVGSLVMRWDAARRGEVAWARLFMVAVVVAWMLVGAALQWGLG